MEQVAAHGTGIQAYGVTLVDCKPLLAAHTASSSAEGERRRPLDSDRGRRLRATRRRGRRETMVVEGDDGEADEDDSEDGGSG